MYLGSVYKTQIIYMDTSAYQDWMHTTPCMYPTPFPHLFNPPTIGTPASSVMTQLLKCHLVGRTAYPGALVLLPVLGQRLALQVVFLEGWVVC